MKKNQVEPMSPMSSTTTEHYELLRSAYPKHTVLDRTQVAILIHALRFDNGGMSWEHVAKSLNENKILHSQWRRETPWWDGSLAGQFARRYGVVPEHIWRQNNPQTSLDLDGTAELVASLQPEGTGAPCAQVKVTFEARGAAFDIEGEWRRASATQAPTINFQYKGVPDPHFLQFLLERGIITAS